MTITRRHLVLAGAAAPLLACAPQSAWSPRVSPDRKAGVFTHSVASGDPHADSVVLWTRFVETGGDAATVGWEIAGDDGFRTIVSRGEALAAPQNDYCAKAIAWGLTPGRRYWYRFVSASGFSPVGRTLTAPAPSDGPAAVTLALFACSNLPEGWFNAYGHAARDEAIDVCVHVGDYFYEYPMSTYTRALPGRTVDPFETVTLPQYYARYAAYRSDPDLQELHRVKPWIMTWDDHDFTNDAWMDGAMNHQPDTEGDWPTRRAAAIKAHRDWTPTRASSAPGGLIHRALPWGRLADLIVLDSRMVGRTNQMDWRPVLLPAVDRPASEFTKLARDFYLGPMSHPDRTILGAAQETWVADQLKASSGRGASWQVVIQGSVLGAALAPPDSDRDLDPSTPDAQRRLAIMRARLGAAGLPYDIPLWCGYPEARRRFLAGCAAHGRNVLALGGETHSGWAFNLPGGRDGRPACVETAAFAVAAGGKARGGPLDKGPREAAYKAASPEIGWCNLAECGYTRIEVNPQGTFAHWIGFNDLRSREARATSMERTVSEATAEHGASPWIAH